MKTILCSIDLSPFSPAVLRYGVAFARRFGARLKVFHAVYSADDQIHRTPLFEQGGERDQRAAAALAAMRTLMGRSPVDWEPLVRTGEPVETLVQAAGECRAEMVIAASHGLGGLKRLLLGRVVERMVRGVESPFLVLRGEIALAPIREESAAPSFRRILVGCGPSSDGQPALEWGARIAAGFGGALTLLHAMESPEPDDDSDAAEAPYTELENDRQQRLRARLLQMLPRPADGSPAADIVLAQGPPADALLEQARRQAPDLVVVGVRRQSGIRRVMVGSTTEAALRHSPCPVLAVPEHGRSGGAKQAALK
jgi:nucleotide-binding universal stress UspA family protein